MRISFERAIVILVISMLTCSAAGNMLFAQQVRVKAVQHTQVVDSRGRIIGTSFGGATIHVTEVSLAPANEVRPTVLLEIDRQIVAVNVGRDRFFASKFIDFDGPNCTGNAWYPADSGLDVERRPLLPRTAIGLPGQTLYVEKQDVAPQLVTRRSMLLEGGNCVNGEHSPQRVPMQPLIDLATVFTPPFSLRTGQ